MIQYVTPKKIPVEVSTPSDAFCQPKICPYENIS